MNTYSVSIVTCSFNSDCRLFEKVLRAVRQQNYDHALIEHLVMDGGSSNGSDALARKFGCRVLQYPEYRDKSLARMGTGIKIARGDIILFLEPDNIIPTKNWLKQMLAPFWEKSVIGAFSMYNGFEPGMPALTRYTALIGVNDPTVYYLNKSEKLPRFEKKYHLGHMTKETGNYLVVRFSKNDLPTLGDNGHMVRRRIIEKVNRQPEKFLHTDAFAQLVDMGYDTYGVVKNEIIHYTGSDIREFIRRRSLYKKRHYDANRRTRHYYVFDPLSYRDRVRLSLFILYSLTFIQPFFIALRGFFAVCDFAWFLHPVVCFASVLSYTCSELSYQWKHLKN